MIGGYFFAWKDIFPLVPCRYLGTIHRTIGTVLFILAILSFLIASYVEPGVITKENYQEYIFMFNIIIVMKIYMILTIFYTMVKQYVRLVNLKSQQDRSIVEYVMFVSVDKTITVYGLISVLVRRTTDGLYFI